MRAWMLLCVHGFPWLTGCLFSRGVATLPKTDALVRDQLVIHCDFDLPQRHRLVEELVARRGDVVEDLRLPVSDEPIHVYLFDSAGAVSGVHRASSIPNSRSGARFSSKETRG